MKVVAELVMPARRSSAWQWAKPLDHMQKFIVTKYSASHLENTSPPVENEKHDGMLMLLPEILACSASSVR